MLHCSLTCSVWYGLLLSQVSLEIQCNPARYRPLLILGLLQLYLFYTLYLRQVLLSLSYLGWVLTWSFKGVIIPSTASGVARGEHDSSIH